MPVTRSRLSRWGLTLALVTLCAALASSYGDVPASLRPWRLVGDITLLPNEWKIAPAGRHVQRGGLSARCFSRRAPTASSVSTSPRSICAKPFSTARRNGMRGISIGAALHPVIVHDVHGMLHETRV